MRENGGSLTRSCSVKMHTSRSGFVTEYESPRFVKYLASRSGLTCRSMTPAYRPRRASARADASMSVAKTWTCGGRGSSFPPSRTSIASV